MWWPCGAPSRRLLAQVEPARAPALRREVLVAMARAGRAGGNASSIHRLGQAARAAVERAEAAVGAAVGLTRGSCAWLGSEAEAVALAVEAALMDRVGPTGGRVRLHGPAWRWQAAGAALSRWRPGRLSEGRSLAPPGGAPTTWFLADSEAAPDGPAHVLVTDAFHPLSGASLLASTPPTGDVQPAPHVHVALGGLNLPFVGEPWRPAGAQLDSLTVASPALGGPPGLCALVAVTGEAPRLGVGTVPKELVVGLGAAALALPGVGPALAARRRQLVAALAARGVGYRPTLQPAALGVLAWALLPPPAQGAALPIAKWRRAGCNLALFRVPGSAGQAATMWLRAVLQPGDAPPLVRRQLALLAGPGGA